MRHHLMEENNGVRTYVVTLEVGESVVSNVLSLAKELNLASSSVSGIGAFKDAQLGYFDWDRAEFKANSIDEQVEVLSFIGNIAEGDDGEPKLHAHVVLGRHDASTRGGHLVEATVRPTLELVIVESPEHLRRGHDEKTGLILLQP